MHNSSNLRRSFKSTAGVPPGSHSEKHLSDSLQVFLFCRLFCQIQYLDMPVLAEKCIPCPRSILPMKTALPFFCLFIRFHIVSELQVTHHPFYCIQLSLVAFQWRAGVNELGTSGVGWNNGNTSLHKATSCNSGQGKKNSSFCKMHKKNPNCPRLESDFGHSHT